MDRTMIAKELLAVARELVGGNVLRYRGYDFPVIRLRSEWDLPAGHSFFVFIGDDYPATPKKAVSGLPVAVLGTVEGIAEVVKGGHYATYFKAYYEERS